MKSKKDEAMDKVLEDPKMGFRLKLQNGWKYKKLHTGYIFGSGEVEGLLMMIFHYNHNLESLKRDMEAGFYDNNGFNLEVNGGVKVLGESMLMAHYTGTAQEFPAVGFSMGLLSPYGGGLLIAAITTPDKFSDVYMDFVEDIARNLEFFQPQVTTQGEEWEDYFKNKSLCNLNPENGIESLKFHIHENGTFVAENLSNCAFDKQGFETGGANCAGQWEVVEIMEQPILRFIFFDGSERQYTLAFENENVYLNNELWELNELA